MLPGVDASARPISVHECRGSRGASTGVQGGPRLPPPGPYGDADTPEMRTPGRESRRLADVLPDLGQERARAVRLGDVRVAAGLERLLVVAAERVRGHRDHRDRLEQGIGLDAPG